MTIAWWMKALAVASITLCCLSGIILELGGSNDLWCRWAFRTLGIGVACLGAFAVSAMVVYL